MKRTNSGFVIVQAGFFSDKESKNTYVTIPGLYHMKDCIKKDADSDRNKLSLPTTAFVVLKDSF